MDSGSPAPVDGGNDSGRSGGKLFKRRRIGAKKTPYDLHTPSNEPENPNWINGLVFPAKYVASGASKLFSSFWNPNSWASHSPSSESDSDSEDTYEGDENVSDRGAQLNKNKGSSSGKSEILYLVEQLLMLECYSREECDRLIEIINSRVVDYTMREGVDAGPKDPDIHNQAITEARKLITENMVGSSSKSDLDNSIHGSKSLMTPNRDYLSGGSWNIQNELQQLRSKAVEIIKPSDPVSLLEAPKPVDETVDLASEDVRTTLDDVPTESLSSLPTIEEQTQMAEEKDVEDEFTEVPDVNASQGSSNFDKPSTTRKPYSPPARRAVTRTRRYGKRGRGRAK